MYLVNFLGFNFGFVIFVLLIFAGLQWLDISAGSFLDWVIAIAIFEWLLVLVTVPWTVHFEAKEVLAEAETSQDKGIQVERKQLVYTRQVAKWSLFIAIVLHLVSAVSFYALAATGISVIGYISSGAALLLTFLRPAVRGYQYLAARLKAIRQQIKYPREDVQELRSRFQALEKKVASIEESLDINQPGSLVATYQRNWQEIRQEVERLKVAQTELQTANQVEHNRLERQGERAIAQLTEDSQFLSHVREIIRFFKTA